MVKKFYIFSAALAVSACAQIGPDTDQTMGEHGNVVLRAYTDDISRTYLDGLQLCWSQEDEIAVYDSDGIQEFSMLECDGSTALFTGNLGSAINNYYYAVSPYGAAKSINGSKVTVNIPSEQTIADGMSIDENAVVCKARFSGSSISFGAVTGLLKFTISDDGISSVAINGNNSEYIAGNFVLKASSTTIESTADGETTITITPSGGGTFPVGTYYAAADPTTYAAGITMTFTDSNGQTATKSSSNSLSLTKGSCVNLGDVTSDLDWTSGYLVLDTGDTDSSDDNVANTSFKRRVYVVYSTAGASVSGTNSDFTVNTSGNDVTLTYNGSDNIIYDLSGYASDGFFKLYSSKKQAIVLNGLTLTNQNGAAINNQSKKRTFVVVQGTNTLADGSSYTDTPSDEDEKAAFFSEGQLIFSGSGSLSVTASGKAGITSDDYVRFMTSPTVTVNSSSGHAIRGKDYILVSNGTISAATSANMKKALTSDSLVVITGGITTLNVSGSAAYDSDDAEYKGSAGIKADKGFNMSGGTLTITNSGKGGKGISVGSSDDQQSLETSTISGGTLAITVTGANHTTADKSSKGIKIGWANKNSNGHTYSSFDGNLVVSGGCVSISSSNDEALEAKGTLTINGGEVYAVSSADDAINCTSTLTVNDGYVYAHSSNNDAIDANGNFYIKGGLVYAATTAGSPEVALDANTEGGFNLFIQGGTIITIGDLESGASISQTCYYASSMSSNTWYGMTIGSTKHAFKTPASSSTKAGPGQQGGGNTKIYFSAASKPTVVKSPTSYSGGTSLFNGLFYYGTSLSGGSTVTLSTYSRK